MIDMQQIDLKSSFVVIIACVNAVFFILITKHVVEEQCRVPECQGTCSCNFSKTAASKISFHRFLHDVQWLLQIDNPDMPVNMMSSRLYSGTPFEWPP